jgi:hypothetical protein
MASNIPSSVPEYYSDPEEITETISSSSRRKKRSRNWIYEKTFSNREAALNFINSEKTWSFHFKNHTEEGNKYYYRCNKSKRRENDCPAGVYLLYNSHNEEIFIFRTENDHDHNNLQSSNRLTDEIKTEIEVLFDLHLKPKAILAKLRADGFLIKNKSQISNYISKLKKSRYGSTKIILGNVEEWCNEHSRIPENEDEHHIKLYGKEFLF